jgi:hypothetical protein
MFWNGSTAMESLSGKAGWTADISAINGSTAAAVLAWSRSPTWSEKTRTV